MPCLRHTSAVFAPASCSFKIAMICSSLNRLGRIVRLLPKTDSTDSWMKSRGSDQCRRPTSSKPRIPLNVLVEMPGVEKENVEISVKDRIVTIEGRIDFQKYAGMNPVYTEYNI